LSAAHHSGKKRNQPWKRNRVKGQRCAKDLAWPGSLNREKDRREDLTNTPRKAMGKKTEANTTSRPRVKRTNKVW